LGRKPLPIINGILSLQESATAIYGRCAEITALIQKAEYKGLVPAKSQLYKMRTGPLRTLIEATSKAIDLGSRRITAAQLEAHFKEDFD
jgi:hypothetical protein